MINQQTVDNIFCQVCSSRLEYDSDVEKFEKLEEWRTVSYHFQIGTFEVVACPYCWDQDKDVIFMRYRHRLASGEDLNYH
jgi:DNA-directed RNA polymerase subunit RPC12/RpoP